MLCCLNHCLLHLIVWYFERISSFWFQTHCSLKGSCLLTPFHLSPCLYPHLLSLSSAVFFSSLSNLNSAKVLILKHFISLTFRWMYVYDSIMWAHLFCVQKKNKTGLIPFDNKMKDWISHIFNSIVNIIIADQLKKKAITDLSLIMAANNVVLKWMKSQTFSLDLCVWSKGIEIITLMAYCFYHASYWNSIDFPMVWIFTYTMAFPKCTVYRA